MTAQSTTTADISPEVHTKDSLTCARSIYCGLILRERLALAAVYENMPCSVSAVARITGMSRRTAQRACDALGDGQLGLIQRNEGGLIIHPDAIGGVDAWAHRHGSQSGVVKWWENPTSTHTPGGRFDPDPDGWPDDVFPEPAFDEVPGAENVELALRAVESRRMPLGEGSFIPSAVLNYITVARSIQAMRIALECGRRADRHGIATFSRGELSKVAGLSPQQVSNALAQMRLEGIATSATTARVELNLTYGRGWAGVRTSTHPMLPLG